MKKLLILTMSVLFLFGMTSFASADYGDVLDISRAMQNTFNVQGDLDDAAVAAIASTVLGVEVSPDDVTFLDSNVDAVNELLGMQFYGNMASDPFAPARVVDAENLRTVWAAHGILNSELNAAIDEYIELISDRDNHDLGDKWDNLPGISYVLGGVGKAFECVAQLCPDPKQPEKGDWSGTIKGGLITRCPGGIDIPSGPEAEYGCCGDFLGLLPIGNVQ